MPGDSCLVFSQFKEMGSLLKTHVEQALGQKALFLHGGVPQKDRESDSKRPTKPDDAPVRKGGFGAGL